jgi:hypothetical protein
VSEAAEKSVFSYVCIDSVPFSRFRDHLVEGFSRSGLVAYPCSGLCHLLSFLSPGQPVRHETSHIPLAPTGIRLEPGNGHCGLLV